MRIKYGVIMVIIIFVVLPIYFFMISPYSNENNIITENERIKNDSNLSNIKNTNRTEQIKETIDLRSNNQNKQILNNFPNPEKKITNPSAAESYLAQNLLTLYKKDIEQIDYNNQYKLIMASIKARGILLDPHNLDLNHNGLDQWNWVVDKQKNIDQIIGNSSPVFYGFSRWGTLFIAIVQPTQEKHEAFFETIKKIRNDDQEVKFLQELADAGYYAMDIYAVDLIKGRKKIDVKEVYIHDKNDDNEYISTHINLKDEPLLQNVLERYDRSYNPDRVMEEREWKLFLFDEAKFPSYIIVEMMDGFTAVLVNTNEGRTFHLKREHLR
ncbi:MAG: hypothetical protein H0Z33_17220 [Bacillaceae bacterium]|nr:hypothetical protein [Bacillaceae bacterium]